MPSMSAAFDIAFGTDDDQNDHLAELVNNISHLSLTHGGSCMMRDNGRRLAVSSHYCAHCSAVEARFNGRPVGPDHPDGEGACIHKQALRSVVADELLELREAEKMADYEAAQIDERPW